MPDYPLGFPKGTSRRERFEYARRTAKERGAWPSPFEAAVRSDDPNAQWPSLRRELLALPGAVFFGALGAVRAARNPTVLGLGEYLWSMSVLIVLLVLILQLRSIPQKAVLILLAYATLFGLEGWYVGLTGLFVGAGTLVLGHAVRWWRHQRTIRRLG